MPPVEVKLKKNVVIFQWAPIHGGISNINWFILVSVSVVMEVRFFGDLLVVVEINRSTTNSVVFVEVNGRLMSSVAILKIANDIRKQKYLTV